MEKGLLPVGTKIKFTTPYGLNAGTHSGVIRHRMIKSGFHPGPLGEFSHYEVEIFLPAHGQTVFMVVTPDMIKEHNNA